MEFLEVTLDEDAPISYGTKMFDLTSQNSLNFPGYLECGPYSWAMSYGYKRAMTMKFIAFITFPWQSPWIGPRHKH